ncbi:hypothetical protein EUGRSUZ_G00711 [Eucalyptus grandis]|uniref:Uncharacterized protein n=2 Tax=Eucalyptus grandis TaxID=71139 RepID=A0ACC3K1R9_EUCGR|nr:hypothetical protein EUGRSUZ_G00711 [Eucalyptus grandis]
MLAPANLQARRIVSDDDDDDSDWPRLLRLTKRRGTVGGAESETQRISSLESADRIQMMMMMMIHPTSALAIG